MKVRLLIHIEPASSGLVWWTESPDVPGFTGAGEHLVETRVRSEIAIREVLAERGIEDVSFSYELVVPGAPSEGPRVERTGDATDVPGAATSGRPVAIAAAA